ncbi:hypothetical protein B0J11DRAFT_501915 [Dendryphion nanum]|uniref:Uncharacterized protein n=1 Tax=Dendryphion nanum TaxID=256645 RepID=A0A9P9IXZ4_9PLEO|nr:hypothetical protein B0J11DRAFT_501915 [Dendryphion nanum]
MSPYDMTSKWARFSTLEQNPTPQSPAQSPASPSIPSSNTLWSEQNVHPTCLRYQPRNSSPTIVSSLPYLGFDAESSSHHPSRSRSRPPTPIAFQMHPCRLPGFSEINQLSDSHEHSALPPSLNPVRYSTVSRSGSAASLSHPQPSDAGVDLFAPYAHSHQGLPSILDSGLEQEPSSPKSSGPDLDRGTPSNEARAPSSFACPCPQSEYPHWDNTERPSTPYPRSWSGSIPRSSSASLPSLLSSNTPCQSPYPERTLPADESTPFPSCQPSSLNENIGELEIRLKATIRVGNSECEFDIDPSRDLTKQTDDFTFCMRYLEKKREESEEPKFSAVELGKFLDAIRTRKRKGKVTETGRIEKSNMQGKRQTNLHRRGMRVILSSDIDAVAD